MIDSSYSHLRRVPHERTITTTQLREEGDTAAYRVQRYRIIPEEEGVSIEEIHREDSGEFDFGWMGLFSGDKTPQPEEIRPPRDLIPDDPGYLAPRNFEDYTYRLLPNTVWNGEAAYGAEVVLKMDADNSPSEHQARAIFSKEDGILLYFSALIVRETLLFNERTFTEWEASAHREFGSVPHPHQTRIITWLDMPLASPREISTQSYFEYQGDE